MSLEKAFSQAIDLLEERVDRFPFEDIDMYCRWMNQQFYLVQNSTRYLALSASKVSATERKEFREWVHHLEEELDHDVLILNDLKRLGRPHSDPIDPITRAMISSQYSDIEKYGANALLGYALMLEGLSCRVCARIAERVESAHGPRTASYLRLHAEVDQDHFPEGLKKITTLNSEQQNIVRMNLDTMLALYVSEFDFIRSGFYGPKPGFYEEPALRP